MKTLELDSSAEGGSLHQDVRALSPSEKEQMSELSEKHKNIRIYRSRDRSITLSRDAMHSPGLREFFWLRFPDTAADRKLQRRGYLVPKHPNGDAER